MYIYEHASLWHRTYLFYAAIMILVNNNFNHILRKALCYKPQGRGFETRWGELIFSIYLIFPAALDPEVYSASNRNEYQKHKNNNVLGE
jgi:hypothetical protein